MCHVNKTLKSLAINYLGYAIMFEMNMKIRIARKKCIISYILIPSLLGT